MVISMAIMLILKLDVKPSIYAAMMVLGASTNFLSFVPMERSSTSSISYVTGGSMLIALR